MSDPSRPLFVVPGLGATGGETGGLVDALRAHVAVHALAPPPLGDAAPRTVEGAAAHCVRIIRAVQPAGPYRLVGWSSGGVTAYEIAAQLVGQDEAVEFLALLDTVHPDAAAPDAYAIGPAPVTAHLFTASDRSGDARLGWGAAAVKGDVRVVPVPGTHETMIAADAEGTAAAVVTALREAEAAAHGGSARAAAFDPQVTIQSGKARDRAHAPVFCVPGAGDHVVQFVGFVSALGDAWPVHGLQYRGVDDGLVPHTSVEAAAAAYLNAIDAVAPDGNAHLIGHSFGGWIAFELALRMAARGRPPRSLTIIDSDAPDGTGIGREFTAAGVYAEFVRALELAAERPLEISAAALAQRDEAGRLRLVHERMVAVGLMPRRSQPGVLEGSVRAFGVALRTGYAPRAQYGGPVAFAFASDPSLGADDDARRQADTFASWQRWAPAATRWNAPGNHLTVLQPPHVGALAAWWQRIKSDSAAAARGA